MAFENYIPSSDDIIWAMKVISLIKSGGLLPMPTTRLVYVVDHETKTLTLQNPFVLYENENCNYNATVHQRCIAVFHQIGYQILVEERPYENP